MWSNLGRVVLQVQFLDDDKYGLLIFHAENLDGVIELDNGNLRMCPTEQAIRSTWFAPAYDQLHNMTASVMTTFALHHFACKSWKAIHLLPSFAISPLLNE